jgi:hypothetical protein
MSSSGYVSPDMIVVSQLSSESPGDFATRVMRRLSRLGRTNPVTRAVMACGPRSDEASLSARARVSQALLAALQNSASAKLTLAAPSSATDALRLQLLAIAGTLLEQSRAPAVDISVQLGEATTGRRAAFAAGTETPKKVA